MNAREKEVRNRLLTVFQDKNKVVQVKSGENKCKTNNKKEGDISRSG